MAWPFHAQGNSMLYALNRDLRGPSASQDIFGEKSLTPAGYYTLDHEALPIPASKH